MWRRSASRRSASPARLRSRCSARQRWRSSTTTSRTGGPAPPPHIPPPSRPPPPAPLRLRLGLLTLCSVFPTTKEHAPQVLPIRLRPIQDIPHDGARVLRAQRVVRAYARESIAHNSTRAEAHLRPPLVRCAHPCRLGPCAPQVRAGAVQAVLRGQPARALYGADAPIGGRSECVRACE